MKIIGSCSCKSWVVEMEFSGQLKDLEPRVCDCDFCKKYPSSVISHPDMKVKFKYGVAEVRSNGDQLAKFSYCSKCKNLLSVTSIIDGRVRGAVNPEMFGDISIYGPSKHVQPYLLSVDQKRERWGKVWGVVNGV